jgi:hypothetical protein
MKKFSTVFFSQFLVLVFGPHPDSLEMLDPDPDLMNPDPKNCNCNLSAAMF